MKTYKGIKIGLFVIPQVFIADATPPKITSIQKDWERTWEELQG